MRERQIAHGLRGRPWEWGAEGARGSRNKIHPAQKILPGLRPGQCPVVLYERKGGREQQDGGRAEKRSGQKAAGKK